MFAAFQGFPDAIKKWRDNRDLLYQVVTALSAALVVAAVATGERPSSVVATVAHAMGASAVADWLRTSAPSILDANAAAKVVALSAVLVLLLWMVIVPLVRSRHDDRWTFGYEQLRLLGSPAAATIWILLVVAAQQGGIAPVLQRWTDATLQVATWTIVALLAGGVVFLLARRSGLEELARMLLRPPAVLFYRITFGIFAALFAVILAAVSLPLSVFSWASSLEPDHTRKRRAGVESERAIQSEQPTGARPALNRVA